MAEQPVITFAEKVERLCDFLIAKLPHGDDRNRIDDLRQEALKVQDGDTLAVDVLSGIGDAIK